MVGPSPAAETWLDAPSGAKLRVRIVQPSSTPRCVLHINHGLAEHSRRYLGFMAQLAEAGFVTVAHDHRGHGDSTAPEATLGDFGTAGDCGPVIDDSVTVGGYARTLAPDGTPFLRFGHSMGGLVALNAEMRSEVKADGLAVWNANAAPGALGRVGQFLLSVERALSGGPTKPSRLMPALTFSAWNKKFAPNRTDCDWLSSDAAQVDAYVDDPACGFPASIGMWQAVMTMARAGEDKAKLRQLSRDLPVNILGGELDPATEGGAACSRLAKRLKRQGLTNVTTQILTGARHECLNDEGAETVTANLIHWAEGALRL